MLHPEKPRTRRADVDVRRTRRPAQSAPAVLGAVLDHGPVARSTVARLTGISMATVSVASAQLIDRGLLREAPEAAGPPGVGRPSVPLAVDTERLGVIGVHVSIEAIRVGLLDLSGRVLTERRIDHDRPAPQDVVATVAEEVAALQAQHGDRDLLGLGATTGGRVDAAAGVVVDHPMLGWSGVPLGDALAAATGLETHVDGHSRALLRAEQLFGDHAHRTRASTVHLFVGNVVDVAFGLGGRVHHGPHSAAGAIAHLPLPGCDTPCPCGRRGCFEVAVSARTMVARAMAEGVLRRPSYVELAEAARAGDPGVLTLFHERARLIGRGAALLLDLFDPEVLTVVASISAELPECLAALRAEAAAHSATRPDPEASVLPTSFPGRFLFVAGGAAALDHVYSAPLSTPVALSRGS